MARTIGLGRALEGRDWARQLVDRLNVFFGQSVGREPALTVVERREAVAWRELATMLDGRDEPARLSDAGIRLFNKRAVESPGMLHLSDQDAFSVEADGTKTPIQGRPDISFRDTHGYACYVLWRVIDAWLLDRVKQCAVCRRWFFDETRNKSAERCSRACTVKWWNRPRRRDARHSQYDPARKRRQKGRTGQ